jgi:hypothetical protein
VDGDAEGTVTSASPLGELSGGSKEPYDHWVAAGTVPAGTRAVEIETPDEVLRARFRSGFWIAAVPIQERTVKFSIRYLDRDGSVLVEREGEEGDFQLPARRRSR